MRQFISNDFLLESASAINLFHDYVSGLPIIDYHCHLSPEDIAKDRQFGNITEAWLENDHYKWRLMRANGVKEKYCSGAAPARAKFTKWAEAIPHAIGNPVYHWSHLELKRHFDIDLLLSPSTADRIWEEANAALSMPGYSVRGLLKKFNIEVICTSDDPLDSLEHHKLVKNDDPGFRMLPGFRPDRAFNIDDGQSFNEYLDRLAEVSSSDIVSYDHFLLAMAKRIDHFASSACKLSDHSFGSLPVVDFTLGDVRKIFDRVRSGREITGEQTGMFRMALLRELASLYALHGWTMQLHLGALRNNNTGIFKLHGPDAGGDSIGDEKQARGLASFLDSLDRENKLPPCIIYNLNPAFSEVIASMTGNFQSCMPGKMQYGPAWWFLDNMKGIEEHLDTVANYGLLNNFVGMTTDSRSYLSFPRHEYFRRILCNMTGKRVEKGIYPDDKDLITAMVRNISYYNAKNYFNF
ncbi:MAG: glucuronate isomerase [Bacteroidales bacterium]|nr:glucuronate isomerase [Bacteroidales bacterium]